MKNHNKRIGIFLIALTVIVAGCTNGNGEDDESEGFGVSIQSFEADTTSIVEQQSTNLQLRTINEGSLDAEHVVVRLFNLPFGDDVEDGVWTLDQGSNVSTHQGGDLRAGDDDLPAEEGETTWTLSAPEIGAQDRDFTAHARLYYMYGTEATSDLELVEDSEWDGVQTEIETSNTDGPIQISVQSRSPIRYFEGDEPQESLCLDIRNEGDGTPLHPNSLVSEDGNDRWDTDGYDDQVEVTISNRSNVEFEAQGEQGSGNTVNASLTEDQDRQCFNMDLPDFDDISIRQDVPLDIDARYGYQVDSSTTLAVESR